MIRKAYIHNKITNPYFAQVDFFDRANTLGDAIYEYILMVDGHIIDLEPHLDRLYRSLDAVRIAFPTCRKVLRARIYDLVRQNMLKNGGIYMQISRGVAPRDHLFPANATPVLNIFVKPYKLDRHVFENGVKVITHDDYRWGRCDIKTTSLIANCLAKQYAKDNGGHEVVFIDKDGYITEGGSSNIWIVDQHGHLRTHIGNHEILNGITKLMMEKLAKQLRLKISNEKFTRNEFLTAREAFITSTSQMGVPITAVDGQIICGGVRGPITEHLQITSFAYMREQPKIL